MKCSEPGCNKEAEVFVDPRNGRILKHLEQTTASNSYKFKFEIEEKYKGIKKRFTGFGNTAMEAIENEEELHLEWYSYCDSMEEEDDVCTCGEHQNDNVCHPTTETNPGRAAEHIQVGGGP